jgi:hypothetical protein
MNEFSDDSWPMRGLFLEKIDPRIHVIADLAGVKLSTRAGINTLRAIHFATGAAPAESRLLAQVIGRARLSPAIRRRIADDLDALLLSRPHLEPVRLLCDGERIE